MEDLLDEPVKKSKGIDYLKDNTNRAKNTIYAFYGVIIIGLYSTYLQYKQSIVF